MKAIAIAILFCAVGHLAAAEPTIIAEGVQSPGTPCFGPEGLLYLTEQGKHGTENDGKIRIVKDGMLKDYVKDLNDLRGMVFYRAQKSLLITEKRGILRIDSKGKVTVEVPLEKFPGKPSTFFALALDEQSQTLLVSAPESNIVYQVNLKAKTVDIAIDQKSLPALQYPLALTFDGASHFIVNDGNTGMLFRVNRLDRTHTQIAKGLEKCTSLDWDKNGRLLITLARGLIYAIPRPGEELVQVATTSFISGACLDTTDHSFVYLEMSLKKEKKIEWNLVSIPIKIPGWEVDESPINVDFKPAFPKLTWTGWDDGSETGKANEHRPVWLTHAGDGSNRIFVLLQPGTIHIIDDENAAKSKVFLDITKKVRFLKNQNEEGLLGMAFHPDYKRNGEFFVFYTDATAKLTNIISRFKVKADNPNEADPASEEILLKIEKPYWNHDGGTIVFGPDGYLYFTHGDGGLANDPHENGQNLKTMLGKVLRIDVNKKENGKSYGIPADNPFVKNSNALPEIYAYGIRNLWRMAFDRKTGKLWAGEVGQNLYEEINIIEKGGNYGWNLRESLHPFGKKGVDVRKDLIEPIWEYHHDIGKSITGGHVYRGSAMPELNGMYLYADYVTPKLWALKYDESKKRVTGNHVLGVPGIAVMSFGEDERGESYILGATPNGRGIYKLVKK